MRRLSVALLASLAAVAVGPLCAADGETPATTPAPAATPTPAVEGIDPELRRKVSYLVGRQLGQNAKHAVDEFYIDPVVLQQAVADALAGKPSAVDENSAQQLFQAYQTSAMALRDAAVKARQDGGPAYLEGIAKKNGIIKTASGLMYEVLTPADGPKPKKGDDVTLHYTGTFIDGKVFDSSKGRDPLPWTVSDSGLIPGWIEAIPLMNKGSKIRLYVPSALAYGPEGRGEDMPGNMVLIFEMELVDVVPAGAGTAAPLPFGPAGGK